MEWKGLPPQNTVVAVVVVAPKFVAEELVGTVAGSIAFAAEDMRERRLRNNRKYIWNRRSGR